MGVGYFYNNQLTLVDPISKEIKENCIWPSDWDASRKNELFYARDKKGNYFLGYILEKAEIGNPFKIYSATSDNALYRIEKLKS